MQYLVERMIRIMKVITDKDWILQAITDEGFLFRDRRFGDNLRVDDAKYIMKQANLVFFCSSSRDGGEERRVTLSRSCRGKLDDNKKLSRELINLLKDNSEYTIDQLHKLSSLFNQACPKRRKSSYSKFSTRKR